MRSAIGEGAFAGKAPTGAPASDIAGGNPSDFPASDKQRLAKFDNGVVQLITPNCANCELWNLKLDYRELSGALQRLENMVTAKAQLS
jgi:hypothetical protein